MVAHGALHRQAPVIGERPGCLAQAGVAGFLPWACHRVGGCWLAQGHRVRQPMVGMAILVFGIPLLHQRPEFDAAIELLKNKVAGHEPYSRLLRNYWPPGFGWGCGGDPDCHGDADPQSPAHALLAGLLAEGLYASLLPIVVYALLGSA